MSDWIYSDVDCPHHGAGKACGPCVNAALAAATKRAEEAEQALSGRTVSCSNCNALAKEASELRGKLEDVIAYAHHAHRARYGTDGKLLDGCWNCGLDIRHSIHAAPSPANDSGKGGA